MEKENFSGNNLQTKKKKRERENQEHYKEPLALYIEQNHVEILEYLQTLKKRKIETLGKNRERLPSGLNLQTFHLERRPNGGRKVSSNELSKVMKIASSSIDDVV